jgi:pimeloyl-ACP methyl ester carboxylesterase/quercetin dioxygenase-like cupin family protein
MRAIASLVLPAALCVASPALSQSAQGPFGDVAHHGVRVDGIRFHYVTAGSGEPVILLPGWPEMSWIAWRKLIPLLVKAGRQVYVLEPRGFGDSDKPQGGYDLDTAARDLHGFLAAAGIDRPGGVDIVAHDVGTWIAHAHAAAYPDDVKRLVLTESNLPGVSPPAPAGIPSEAVNLKSWQFAFNRLDDLPEILVQGRERAYLAWLFATKTTRNYAIEPAAFDEYVRVFSAPGVARAGFAWYRAAFSPEGLAQAKLRAARRLPMPVLALGGTDGVGDALRATVAAIGDRVKGGAIGEGCGHFLPSECPDELAAAVLAFWRENAPRAAMSGSGDRPMAALRDQETSERSRDDLAGKLARRELQRSPSSIPGREIVQVITEIPAGVESGWHVHPGEEVGYIVAGQVEMTVQGRGSVTLRAGDGFLIPPRTPHNALDLGPETGRMLSTYIVETGQPLATFVDRSVHMSGGRARWAPRPRASAATSI